MITSDYGSGFNRFFYAGGWLVWFVLLPLSMATVSLIVQYFMMVRRSRLLPGAVSERTGELLNAGQYESADDFLREDKSFLGRTLHAGLIERKNGRAVMENSMAEVLEHEATNLLRKVEWLNIIGNVAPMVGLFGTVWGMIDAFTGIVRAGGQPEPADLAGGISTALVTTWWGLVVAIPALAAYGVLRNRIDTLSSEVAVVADELLRSVGEKSTKSEYLSR
jgi:biopolymer transport protein ExbB